MDNRDEFSSRQAARKAERRVKNLKERRRNFVLSRNSFAGALIAASLVSAFLGTKIQPSEVKIFFEPSSVSRADVVQPDLDDYTSKVYFVETRDGSKYEIPFNQLDKALPRDTGYWTGVNLDDNRVDSTVLANRVEEFPLAKNLLIFTSALDFVAGVVVGAETVKGKKEFDEKIAETESGRKR